MAAISLYGSVVGKAVGCLDHSSFYMRLWRRYKRCKGFPDDAGHPAPWFGEVYQLCWLLLACIALLGTAFPGWVRWVACFFLGYRILELTNFALAWLFLYEEVWGAKRSLACFLVNSAEVVVCFAAFYAFGACWVGPLESLEASQRLFLTEGPDTPPCDAWWCRALSLAELSLGPFLIVLVVGNIVGSIKHRPRSGSPSTPRPDESADLFVGLTALSLLTLVIAVVLAWLVCQR